MRLPLSTTFPLPKLKLLFGVALRLKNVGSAFHTWLLFAASTIGEPLVLSIVPLLIVNVPVPIAEG